MVMGGSSLPPGFRFHPTDEELIAYYLKRKVEGLEIELEVIPVIDLYKCDPWELPEKSFLPKRDMEWFFFCPRDRKYPNGSRTNRATKAGYWKATGKDRNVASQSSVIGYRKTLVFYRGRAPSADRTDWVMHEYRLCDDHSQGSPSFQGGFALCRVIKRNENTQKINDFNDQPKSKRVSRSSSNGDFASTMISNSQPMIFESDIAPAPQEKSRYDITTMPHFAPPFLANNSSNVWVSPNLILDSSMEFQQGQQRSTLENYQPYEFQSAMTACQPYDYIDNFNINTSSPFSNFTKKIEPTNELSRICNMSPYSGDVDYMGFWGNEDMTYHGYDHNNSLISPNSY